MQDITIAAVRHHKGCRPADELCQQPGARRRGMQNCQQDRGKIPRQWMNQRAQRFQTAE
ncbi:hypothetical protein [Paraburkholderia sp. BL6665CI2N2]|uniref:hypothetical protein n=1 Tax=Paraburkholderia sp. BL6665CI2N2 TaxID=1938806 RepID=UPI001FBB5171|nr:hypothetical protein [Paraburkholderia sp. BL6665CI2N2]